MEPAARDVTAPSSTATSAMLGVRAVRLRFPFPGRRRDFCSHADRGFMILPLVARQVNPQGNNRSRKTLPTPPRSRELDIPLSLLANFEVWARVSSHERLLPGCRHEAGPVDLALGVG